MLESPSQRLEIRPIKPGSAANVDDAQLAALNEPLNRTRVDAQEMSRLVGGEEGRRFGQALCDFARLGVTAGSSLCCSFGCWPFARFGIQSRRPVVEAELAGRALSVRSTAHRQVRSISATNGGLQTWR